MAVEFTIYCDRCGSIINASTSSVRAARAEAQLQCGAVSSGGKDWCASCRKELGGAPVGDALKGAHSIGTRR